MDQAIRRLNPGKYKRFTPSSKFTETLWGPTSLLCDG